MDIDRRRALAGMACSALAGLTRRRDAGAAFADPGLSGIEGWHPLTRSLLERARRIDHGYQTPDRGQAECAIRRFSDASGWAKPLVIKWIDTPADAYDHLRDLGLDVLLDMGPTSFWSRSLPLISPEQAFDRAFGVRMIANELLRVEHHDRILMAPKLLAKADAMSANLPNEAIFRIRAVSAQIGWLEASLADAAAQAISNVEALLSMGESDRSVAIDHQLKVFETYENGLMATWETPNAFICVPMTAKTKPHVCTCPVGHRT